MFDDKFNLWKSILPAFVIGSAGGGGDGVYINSTSVIFTPFSTK